MRRPIPWRPLLVGLLVAGWIGGNALLALLLPPAPRFTLARSYFAENVHGFSPDDRLLVTSGNGVYTDPIHLVDVWTGAERAIAHADPAAPKRPRQILRLHFSADGRRLVWCDSEPRVHLWDLADDRELAAFAWPDGTKSGDPRAIELAAPDADTVLAVGEDIVIWDVPAGRVRAVIGGWERHRPWESHLFAVSPDGRTLADWSADAIRLFDVVSGRPVGGMPAVGPSLYGLRFAPDGRSLIAGDLGKTWGRPGPGGPAVHAWDVAGRRPRWSQPGTFRIADVRADVVITVESVGRDQSRLVRRDVRTGVEQSSTMLPHDYTPEAAAGDRLLVRGGADATALEWLHGQLSRIRAVARVWPPGYRRDETRVLDAATGATLAVLPPAKWCLLAPDGRTAVTGEPDGAVRLWDVPPRKPWDWFAAAVAGQAALAVLIVRWRRRVRDASPRHSE
jgi:WD40 repeat protein